jgi:hypothetical protein
MTYMEYTLICQTYILGLPLESFIPTLITKTVSGEIKINRPATRNNKRLTKKVEQALWTKNITGIQKLARNTYKN